MKPSVQIFKSNQPKMLSKREDKKSINLRWNSGLIFQIGLILSLIAVFFVVESTIGVSADKTTGIAKVFLEEPPVVAYVVEIDKPKVIAPTDQDVKRPKEKKQILNIIDVIDNKNKLNESKTISTDVPVDPDPVKTKLPIESKQAKNTTPTNIMGVEFVPVFPGCESLSENKEKIACMSDKIRAFIGRKFNTDKFSDMNPGKQRITVQFKIDINGNVMDVRARSKIKELQVEAERVVSKLPQMRPGRQGDNAVDVQYMVPITFRID